MEMDLRHVFEEDPEYQAFQCSLMPTVDSSRVLGIRVPALRKYAGQLAKDPSAEAFLKNVPHRYYEENNLHMYLLEKCSDYEKCIQAIDDFLPYVDNWATCDGHRFKAFKGHEAELFEKIREWLISDRIYTVRFGLNMLMTYFLDEHFSEECLELASSVRSEEYYINMMNAWLFATALAKQYDAAIVYLEDKRLDQWTHNKTIQKAVESYRISQEQKIYLKGLRRKGE